ncbi:hypothetical protein NQ317_005892 [Molorchus minor]|uniref:DUF229 domain containing protein n=1 Tax=Molorchus minor TaxID=1323400 RepID=A0ABQ9JZX5_9CUCU|nr:hypothetical protein NQ317_005892 [Molorchus minor]
MLVTLSNGMEIDDTKIRVPPLLWIPLLVCGALLFFIDVFQIRNFSLVVTTTSVAKISEVESLTGYAINTPGCKIPDMDPFDQHIKMFIEKPTLPICNNGTPALFESNLTSIYLKNSSLRYYNSISNVEDLRCCYKAFWRREPKDNENDNKIELSTECKSVTKSADISDEFINVVCSYENVTVYNDMFSFVPVKNNIGKPKTGNPTPLNILVVGLDAVSRLNLRRQMPKTVNYLKELDAVELLGYNKVGDNTFPNLIPVLTGMTENELRNSCWHETQDHFDDCDFIWNYYKKNDYVTVYGEDSSWMGLFNYQRMGFRKQPTDYGYSYFNRKSEQDIGNSHHMNVDECEGARHVYKDLLEYIKKFKQFAIFWLLLGASLSHDFLNKPSLGDDDYYAFFKALKKEGHLESTALFFISDHGIRWGDIRQTYQGRMEERLPFVILYLPKWYKEQNHRAYKNLERNVRRLTTPFDLRDAKRLSRGYSLFSEITKERTCEDAAIDSHWCTCQQGIEIEKSASIVTEASNYAINYINLQLEGYAQCAKLTLDSISDVRLMTYSETVAEGKNKIQDYMITFSTVPGKGIFEVTVRHSEEESQFSVMGTISRLNLYGTQSSCITDFHLKLYCYCKNVLQ